MNYRDIFKNDKVSFGKMQVVPLAQEFLKNPNKLENYWVYDDEFVKGLLHIEDDLIYELYVDSFFENKGIGSKLIRFAIEQKGCKTVWALEKNKNAIRFYERNGFKKTGEKRLECGTSEYVVKLKR